MHEIIRIRLGHKLPRIRLLHEILIPLFLCKADCIFFALEVDMCALHEIRGRLPAHQGVLPPVAFGEHVPIHSPVVPGPVSGLRGGFGGPVDSTWEL